MPMVAVLTALAASFAAEGAVWLGEHAICAARVKICLRVSLSNDCPLLRAIP